MKYPRLHELSLRGFRCFRELQTGRLAPLTLLVGENGTGKTSFLAAVREILRVASHHDDPDFRSPPYDLGSFPEIGHRHHADGRQPEADSIGIGFRSTGNLVESIRFNATFTAGVGGAPTLTTVCWSDGDVWIRDTQTAAGLHTEVGCSVGAWRLPTLATVSSRRYLRGGDPSLDRILREAAETGNPAGLQPLPGNSADVPAKNDYRKFANLYSDSAVFQAEAFAEAPVRSGPRRTYDPTSIVRDPKGTSVPAYLADAYARNPREWDKLKHSMEAFGRNAGLFDELFVRNLGRNESTPFQMEARKWGKEHKGAKHNLIDVGYGASQVLPLLLELFIEGGYEIFLLQQPEVHLHPSAQAELGSLLCTSAASGRQLIVETQFGFLPADRVYAITLNVYPYQTYAAFCALQSRTHEIWARFFGSSLEERLRYTHSDCFETFPFPDGWETQPALEAAGKAYYDHRAALMVGNREGMTKTYNRFHDFYEHDPSIADLRDQHAAMDRAVLDAYGWTDIPIDCDFLLDHAIDEETWGRKKKPYRYRWPDPVRDEVLARLLALNADRAAAEARAGTQTPHSLPTTPG